MRSKSRSLHGVCKDLMEARGFETETLSAEWILEYVLRHCNDDWIVSELVRVLPFPNEDLRLKKMILLRKISSDVSKGSISEKTLESLNSLKELNRQLCKNYEKNIQELCCKVAVECTLKHLRDGKTDWEGYNEALKKLWCDCIEDTEDVEMDGELPGRVNEIKKELFAVASDHMLRDTFLGNYRKEDVLESLCAFLKDAWDEIGPTFLENVAEYVVDGKYNPSGEGANHLMQSGRMAIPSCETRSADGGKLQEAGTLLDVRLQETGIPSDIRIQESRSPDVADKVAENIEDIAPTFPPPWADLHPSAAPDSRKERIAQISGEDASIRKDTTCFDSHDGGQGSVHDHNDVDDQGTPRTERIRIPRNKGLLTPLFVKTTEDLRQSNIELHSRVDDPLPDALNFAEEHVSRRKDFPSIINLDENNLVEKPYDEVDKSVVAESDKGRDNQVRQTKENGSEHHQSDKSLRESVKVNIMDRQTEENSSKHHQSDKSHRESVKVSIMDRNPTARTFQWGEDSVCSPENDSPSASRKVRLPTPPERHISPLKRPRIVADIMCRRRHTKWSTLEEETLKNEVLKYGKGRWKFILEKNRHIFEERTEVDLKDKWRNIARREGLHAP